MAIPRRALNIINANLRSNAGAMAQDIAMAASAGTRHQYGRMGGNLLEAFAAEGPVRGGLRAATAPPDILGMMGRAATFPLRLPGKAAKLAGRGAFLTGPGRMLTGAAVGGIYAGVTSDSASPTSVFGDVLGGAMIGAGIGALTTRTAFRGLGRAVGIQRKELAGFPLHQQIQGAAWQVGRRMWGIGKAVMGKESAGRGIVTSAVGAGARGAINLVANHPRAVGIGLGAVAIGHMASAGPAGPGMRVALGGAEMAGLVDQERGGLAQLANVPSTGYAPGMGAARQQQANAMFINSTMGLTQGLHRARHR
jgi:hypothetical protein